jgi:hypothetical protein
MRKYARKTKVVKLKTRVSTRKPQTTNAKCMDSIRDQDNRAAYGAIARVHKANGI